MHTQPAGEDDGAMGMSETGGSGKAAGKRKRVKRSGMAAMQKAAERQVARSCKALAALLTEKALAGNISSAKLLVTLAEQKPEMKKPDQPKGYSRWVSRPPEGWGG